MAVFLAACDTGNEYLPQATGAQGEVLVVMDKGYWEGPPGQAVREVLGADLRGLPRPEPRFDLAQCTRSGFGSMLRAHRNVLVCNIGPTDSNHVQVGHDRWSRGQVFAEVGAPDPMTWTSALRSAGNKIARSFDDAELARLMAVLPAKRDPALTASIGSAFGIELDIPQGFRMMERTDHFAWLQRDHVVSGAGLEHDVIEGLLIYTFPYVSNNTFTVPYLVDARDSITRAFVNGPDSGSYMIVQRRFEDLDLMPESRATEIEGRFAFEMRGLFGMHGAKMGGPFIELATIDEARHRVVCVDGFVYAPQFDKREYLRGLEAIIRSLHLPTLSSR